MELAWWRTGSGWAVVLGVGFLLPLFACDTGNGYLIYRVDAGVVVIEDDDSDEPLLESEEEVDAGPACPSGRTRCLDEGRALETCGDDDEAVITNCEPFGCEDGVEPKVCRECDPARVRQCTGNTALICSALGDVIEREECGGLGCNDESGRCNQCAPSSLVCDGQDLSTCDAQGTIGEPVETCEFGCQPASDVGDNARCRSCQPGSSFCREDALVSCDADGEPNEGVPCVFGCSDAVAPPACQQCDPEAPRQCLDGVAVLCSPQGFIVEEQDCGAPGCAAETGECRACIPDSVVCDDDASVTCSAEGDQETRTACAFGCHPSRGTCHACWPDTEECHDDDFVVCDSDGEVVSAEDCTALSPEEALCNVGACTASGCLKDPAPRENSFCGSEALCCDGACIASDDENCGACGNVCEAPQAGCDPVSRCFRNSCIDKGVIVVSELQINPSSSGDNDEWVELYNPTHQHIDLGGWILRDNGTDAHVISTLQPVVVPAMGYAVLTRSNVEAAACGVDAVYTYGDFRLGNDGDEVILGVPKGAGTAEGTIGCEVDRVTFSANFDVTGMSRALRPEFLNATDNDSAASWCTSSAPLSCGDTGTPGAPNDCP
ncbi:MAG: lamin tail domain-containing protein [Myxococcota bacterium]